MTTTTTQEQSPYIKLLEYVYKNAPVTLDEIKIETNIYESRIKQITNLYDKNVDHCIEICEKNELKDCGREILEKEQYYRLSYQGTMNYLEYVELQQSRKFAKQASDHAKNAMKIAIISVVISAILATVSIYRPVIIDQTQIDEITKTATTIQSQIDQIIDVEKTSEMQLDQLNSQIRLLTLNMQMGRMRRNYSTSSIYIKTLTPNDSVWSRYKFLGEDIILFYDHFGD